MRNLSDWNDLGAVGVSYITNRIGYKGRLSVFTYKTLARDAHDKIQVCSFMVLHEALKVQRFMGVCESVKTSEIRPLSPPVCAFGLLLSLWSFLGNVTCG